MIPSITLKKCITNQRNARAGAEYSDAPEDDAEAVSFSSAVSFDSNIDIITINRIYYATNQKTGSPLCVRPVTPLDLESITSAPL